MGGVHDPRASFEEAFDDLWARSYGLAHRLLGSRAAAEDVAAEALTRAWLHWRKIADLPWRDGWVLRTTSNLATDTLRRRPRFLAARPSVDVADVVTDRQALLQGLAALPKRQREVVVLRQLCDLSEADTAAALSLRTGTVAAHLHRGLAALRSDLASLRPDEEVPDVLSA